MRARRGRLRSSGMRAHVTTGRGRGMLLPKRVLARLTCDGDLRLAGIGRGGHPADIGRRSRKVPPDLRRALQLRDRHCRFPGCEATRFLHAHHVVHWARGGATDLANLLLLCAHHHRFVHDHDWALREVDAAAGRWSFHPPGQPEPVPAVWAMPGASAASLAAIRSQPPPGPYALQPPWWDGAGYDLNETLAMVTDWILDAA